MMEACGFSDIKNIQPSKFFRGVDEQTIMNFKEIYCKSDTPQKKQQQFELQLN